MTQPMILCYHAVSPTWEATLSITPEQLQRQLQTLAKGGWQGTTFRQAVVAPPHRRTLAVTFDDAFASVLEYAEPVLATLGWPATVFAPTAFMTHRQPLSWDGIDHWSTSDHVRELTGMDWNDLGSLQERGWEIGSHTRTHPHLTQIPHEQQLQELLLSREECQAHLGRPCDTLAYPYGDVDKAILATAHQAGYRAGAALSHSLRAQGPLLAPRIGIYHTDEELRFRLKTTPITRRLRASRLWPTT